MDSRVFNIDCMVGMSSIPDKSIDLAICDIPYGIDVANMAYLKEKKTLVKQKNGAKLTAYKNKISYQSEDWDKKTPPQEYFDELVRVSKNQIIFGVDYVNWTGLGSGRIIWDKCVADGVSFSRYETAYCSIINHSETIPLLWSGMMQAKSISEPTIQQGNKKLNEKRIHPCHKPIMLYDIILLKFGSGVNSIIDTHVGGGSSRISAYRNNISFTGYEINKKYFDDQEKRFNDYSLKLKLF